jgi:predicted DNA-binding antitoxin AbrB/MazE fold protein
MLLIIEAIYENGVLRPVQPLSLKEQEKVLITIQSRSNVQPALQAVDRGYGLLRWTGPVEELDYLISDPDNDPLEEP